MMTAAGIIIFLLGNLQGWILLIHRNADRKRGVKSRRRTIRYQIFSVAILIVIVLGAFITYFSLTR